MRARIVAIATLVATLMAAGCAQTNPDQQGNPADSMLQEKVAQFDLVRLESSTAHLSAREKEMLPILYRVAQIMDDLFWKQAWGDKASFLDTLSAPAKAFALINYGPYERLNSNIPFLAGVSPKPAGANFYPHDMTAAEFDALADSAKKSLYTVIVRQEDNSLASVPYSEYYKAELTEAAGLLKKAAELADDPGLKNYLTLRADALLSNDYLASDLSWMDMKSNLIDFVVGPIENYEDQLYGYKAAFEAFILLKDTAWSAKLDRYAALLPALQRKLPVEDKYKTETPGSSSDLGVYDVVFYGGDCNAGSKTIAINLPNDPVVHVQKGSRKLQLKNAMRYKFERILQPIADLLIDPSQRKHVTFDAFFNNTMLHEVAHGLGVKQTINGKGDAQSALKETYSSIEENKADMLGLFLVEQLSAMGELGEVDLTDNYVTFMAGIFRSVRFGAASAHGKANMMRFNYFLNKGAFARDEATGYYRVDNAKMSEAISSFAGEILRLQGDGNYEGALEMLQGATISETLQGDLDRLSGANIPVDLRYEQGPEVLGLQPYSGAK